MEFFLVYESHGTHLSDNLEKNYEKGLFFYKSCDKFLKNFNIDLKFLLNHLHKQRFWYLEFIG